jgi:hypothetical protein
VPKKDITAGERLCTFIKKNVLDRLSRSDFVDAVSVTGRGERWVEFVEEAIATQLAGRLVIAGKSIAETLGGKSEVGQLQFRQEVAAITYETMSTKLERTAHSKLLDSIERAVLASYGNVSEADKEIVRDEAGRSPRCYLCNALLVLNIESIDSPTDEQRKRVAEYEHVWPRAFGGNTEIDNLALSCNDCNNRKASYANWAMVDIQSLILCHNPSSESLGKTSGLRRFALLSYAAHSLASEESLTLKAAHMRIQSKIASPRTRRISDVADFFNLVCHTENP